MNVLAEMSSAEGASGGMARTVLRKWLTSGQAPNLLPSERQIARNLGVAQPTVHRAMLLLEQEGLITREGRIRRPAMQVLSQSTPVLSRSIIVVSPYRVVDATSAHSDAWIDGSSRGVFEALAAHNSNALFLRPGTLLSGMIPQLVRDAPTGVVIPDLLNPSREEMEQLIRPFIAAGIPVAAYVAKFELPGVDQIVSDHEDGAYQLTSWLLAQGRRKIIRHTLAHEMTMCWAQSRRRGYERAMREAGLAPMPDLEVPCIPFEGTLAKTIETRARLCAGFLFPRLRDVDAIMAVSDGEIPVLAKAVRVLEREPNRDIALAGYDNYWNEIPERSLESTPPVATVDKLNLQAGRELVQLMLDRSTGKLGPEPVIRVIKPRLVTPVAKGT